MRWRYLVVVLCRDHRLSDVRAKVGGLVPSHGVVVYVDLPEASHHVVLVFGTILSQLLVGALRAGWEWEAVGHLEGATVIKSQQLTSHKLWQMLLAVFYDFQHHQAIQFD